jgi:hypothetical protein
MKNQLKVLACVAALSSLSYQANALDKNTHYPFQPKIEQPASKTCAELQYLNSRLDYFNSKLTMQLERDNNSLAQYKLKEEYEEYTGVKFQKFVHEQTIKNFYVVNRNSKDAEVIQKANDLISCLSRGQ